jgi:hypothetical protein
MSFWKLDLSFWKLDLAINGEAGPAFEDAWASWPHGRTGDTVAKSGYDRSPTWLQAASRNRYSMRFLAERRGRDSNPRRT